MDLGGQTPQSVVLLRNSLNTHHSSWRGGTEGLWPCLLLAKEFCCSLGCELEESHQWIRVGRFALLQQCFDFFRQRRSVTI